MSDTVIRVENLSKFYRLGQVGGATLREDLQRWWAGIRGHDDPSRRIDTSHATKSTEHWALKDVSFEVKQGEVLGVIGRNGAGKSTLLKILSRTTAPTQGRISIKGRIGSLLEVGTGFHPELSGRENIYLNGAILGMKKAEIDRKLDEIIDFSGVERFIDTPVKRYSSGMYVRLAFAVAAHLEPEILILDEVLAVGDSAFQKKCLGKMGEVASQGRTVLFVSHNMAALAGLCSRAILLTQGSLLADGPANDIIRQYIELGRESIGEKIWPDHASAPGSDKVRLHAVRIVSDEAVTSDIEIDKEIRIEIEFWNMRPDANITTSIHLLDQMGVGVLASANMHSANLIQDEWFGKPHVPGLYKTVCTIPANFLNEGRYSINVIVLTDVTNPEVFEQEVLSFTTHETGEMRKEFSGQWLGVVRPKLAWNTQLTRAGIEEVTA